MKPIVLTEEKNKFLYQKLYESLKEDILNGTLRSGERLPSLRALSKDMGLSLTTVGLAYDQLLVEGYVYVKPQSGYYVSDVKTLENYEASSKYDEIDNFTFKAPTYIHDKSSFDFNKWKKCSQSVFNDLSDQLLFESDPMGEMALRYEISKYLLRSRGVKQSPDRIVIGAGTQQITSLLSRVLQKMGIDIVSLETPGYLPVKSMFRDGGFNLFSIPVGKEGIEISKLPTNISSAVYVSPSNQFPTGAVMPIGKRYELLSWARENKSIIIEDDYDSELRYFGKPVPSLQGLDQDNLVVYLGSFSSTLFPAIKISYMVLPKEMAEIFTEIKKEYIQTCSKAEQLTLALFMEKGYYQTGIRRLRSIYSQKLEKTISAIEKYGKNQVSCDDTKSGISITIKVKSQLDEEELIKRATNLGIQLVPVSKMSDIKSEKGISVLSLYYSQIPLEDIETLVSKLFEAWDVL